MATITAAAGGGNWNANATWVGSVQPTAADDVLLASSSGQVTIPTGITALCRSLDCTGYTNTLTFATTTSTLTVGNSLGGAVKFVNTMTLTLTGIGTINFVASQSAATFLLTTAGLVMPNLTVNTAGATPSKIQFADAVNATGAIVKLTAGSLDFNSKAVTCASWTYTAGTLTTGTQTLTLSGGVATFTGGGQSYSSVALTGSGTSNILGTNTFVNLTRTGTAAKTDSLTVSADQTITGILTLTGNSAVNRLLVNSNTAGTPRVLTVTTTVTVNAADFRDITGAGAASWNIAGVSQFSGDCDGNTGITFTTPATQTATGTASFTWSTHGWTTRVPLPQDDVVISNAFIASQTVTMDMPRLGRNIDMTGGSGSPTLSFGTLGLDWFGSLTFVAGVTLSGTGGWLYRGRRSSTLTSAGVTFVASFTLTCPTGTLTLVDAFATSSTLATTNGTFNDGGQSVTLTSSGATYTHITGTLTASGAWSFATTTAVTFWNVASGTVTHTGSITLTAASANTRTFAGGGQTYGALTYTVADSPGVLSITGANTIGTLNVAAGRRVTFPSSVVNNITSLSMNGEARDYVYLPGVSGSYISTPSATANRITGDITIDAKVRLPHWVPGAINDLVAKEGGSTQRSYVFRVAANGKLEFYISSDGSALTAIAQSTVAPTVADNTDLWVRWCRNATTGTVRYYTSPDGSTWTQLGTDVSATAGAVFASTGVLELGSRQSGTQEPFTGRVYNAKVYSSDLGSGAGTPAQSFDANAQLTSNDTWTNPSTAEVWALNGLAAQGDGRITVGASTGGTPATLAAGPATMAYAAVKDITATPSDTVYVLDGTNTSGNTGIVFEPNTAQHPSLRNASLAAFAASVGANGAAQRAASW